MLRTPDMAPLNMVNMINLESCVLQTLTYFSTAVLGSANNAFDVYSAAGAFQHSLWKNILKSLGKEYAQWINYPLDPLMN